MNNSIFWFRHDLRLSDNPGLLEAVALGKVLPIYIYDDTCPKEFKMGAASKTWLYHSLQSVQKSLNNSLNLYQGNPRKIIEKLVHDHHITHVFCSTSYEPWGIQQEESLKEILAQLKVNYKSYNSSYLWAPGDALKDDGTYYKVFTAYKKKLHAFSPPRNPLPKPKNFNLIKDKENKMTIEDFSLISQHDWHKKIIAESDIGEDAAEQKLSAFIQEGLSGYKKGRDYPYQEHVSKLSPHLHFGEISPHQIWSAIHATRLFKFNEADVHHFLSEITWREFSCYLMSHFENLHKDNFQSKFNKFPWKDNEAFLKAWQTGKTGYPIIDAGMRELWETGYMHNRVRMIVASFLVKNLMLSWHYGRDWFWDCLIDADLANNSASWQWVAGCGADAAPYFRIFNPVTQGEKFDGDGNYTRQFVPELKLLPNKYLFKPWEAPKEILDSAGVILGGNYPKPIIDLKTSREAALLAYKSLTSF
jgi:deoxyribodipyrimidine photo-lyase